MKLTCTPVESVTFDNRRVYVKRDDLLHPAFSGNKARKFAYYLQQTFAGIDTLVGYGSPQANSLYSMSVLAKLRGWQLKFYVDHIATHLKEHPVGNYRAALANGASIIELCQVSNRGELTTDEYIRQRVVKHQGNVLYVPEGGRCCYAEFGVRQLAQELVSWKQTQGLSSLQVYLPSGTGTTALYLQKSFLDLDPSIRVRTCAVVGGEDYLIKQFVMLEPDRASHPEVITTAKKYHFGKLYPEFYQIWLALAQTGITFELLYDPLGWLCLRQDIQQGVNEPILYLHQGGLLGNESMLPRYRRKYGGGKTEG